MRRQHRRLGFVGVIALLLVSLVGATVAWALWTRNENGDAGAASRTMTFTVTADAGTADLYPSSSATGSVKFTVTNPNPFVIEVTGVTGNGSVTPDDATACPAANVTIETVSGLSGANYQATGSGGTKAVTVAGVLKMATTAPDGCQGRTFTVPLTVSAQIITS
jgi:hypothetical protein